MLRLAAHTAVVAVASVLIIGFNVSRLALRLKHRRWHAEVFQFWGRLRIPGMHGGAKVQSSQEDAMEERIVAKMNDIRKSILVPLSEAFCWFTIMSLLWIAVHLSNGIESTLTVGQETSTIVSAICATIVCCRPTVLLTHWLSCAYSLTMLCVTMTLSTCKPCTADYIHVASFSGLARIAFSINHGHFPAVVFWNLTGSCASFSVFWRARHSVDEPSQRILQHEMLYCGLAIISSILTSRALRAHVQSMLLNQTLKGESSAMSRLLHLMCDAVIELDEDLKIAEDAPEFSSMITFGSVRECIKGIPLREFMATPEDEQTFDSSAMACTPATASVEPGALHLSLGDGIGVNISVEMLYAEHKSVDPGGRRFYVGIREFGERKRDIAPLGAAPALRSRRGRGPASAGGLRSHSCRSSSSGSSGQGTPRGILSEQLAALGAGPHQAPPPAAVDRLYYDHLQETSPTAVQIAIVMCMRRWNIRTGRLCCHYHAALAKLHECVSSVPRRECKENFKPSGDVQCTMCGTLGMRSEDWRCDVCETTSFVPVSVPDGNPSGGRIVPL